MYIHLEPATLEQRDIRALKTCDTLSFHFNAKPGTVAEDALAPVCQISAKKDADDTSPWDQTHTIACAVRLTCYTAYATGSLLAYEITRARHWESVYASQAADALHTWLSALKVGDQITLEWIADCYTPEYVGGGKHLDRMNVVIRRKGKNGNYRDAATFNLGLSLCLDNTARMCTVQAVKPAVEVEG